MIKLIRWHKLFIYRTFKKRLGLTGYQISWIAFAKGFILGVLLRRFKIEEDKVEHKHLSSWGQKAFIL